MTKLDLAHLSTRQTTVVQGAKSARGQDAIEGTVMQFSSLMSVMNEDFALMNEMQREYVAEKSEISVPQEIREREVLDDVDIPMDLEEDTDFDLSEIVHNFAEKEEPRKEVVADEELVALPEVFSDPAINTYSIEQLDLDAMVEMPVLDETNTASAKILPLQPVIQDAVHQLAPSQPVEIEVPDIEVAKFEIVDEVLKVVDIPDDLMMEESKVEGEDASQEDFGLRDLLKRDFLFEDEFVIEEESPLVESQLEQSSVINRPIQPRNPALKEEAEADNPIEISAENIEVSSMNASISAGISTVTTATAQPTAVNASSDVNLSNVQEKRDKEDLPKLPKNLRHQSHFSEMLENADNEVLEKMSFNNKLLRRLELVVNDPAGKLDVEIAQDPIGVHVKAVVPTEVLKSMQGLQQDLQVALYQKGLELGSFEMQERGHSAENNGSTKTISDIESGASREKIEESAVGGILVNQRV